MILQPHAMEECYGSRAHCHWHNVDEPDQGAFRACFECGHAYATKEDLDRAWREEWPFSTPLLGRDGAPGCAYCGHDW